MYHFRRRKQKKNTIFSYEKYLHEKIIDFYRCSSSLTVSSTCLFPPEFEGEYIIQNAAVNSDSMQYSTINITNDWIFPYGQCYSRNEGNVIVAIR